MKSKRTASSETTRQRTAYMVETEYKNRVARRENVDKRMKEYDEKKGKKEGDSRLNKRQKKHEGSKEEQEMVSKQVFESMAWYAETKKELTKQEWKEIEIGNLNEKGVQEADEERAIAMNEAAKAKAAKWKKPDKTVDDFIEEAERETSLKMQTGRILLHNKMIFIEMS